MAGFAANKLCSEKKRTKIKNRSKNTTTVGKTSTNEWTDSAAVSIQLSVEDSLDSYYLEDHCCEDWSVSVVSWAPRETDGMEVEARLRNQTKNTTSDDIVDNSVTVNEIEIEFEACDLEGYENALGDSFDNEDPPLFDVIDLFSTN